MGANDVRGPVDGVLNPEVVRAFGAGFAAYLGAEEIIIGHDPRPSSHVLKQALIDGIRSRGTHVTDIGMTSTDLLYFATGRWDTPGAVVTASHNPLSDNGIKFCGRAAVPIGRDTGLTDIAAASSAESGTPPRVGRIVQRNPLPEYVHHLQGLMATAGSVPPLGLRVVVDAGFGAASVIAPPVLEAMGVDLTGIDIIGSEAPSATTMSPDPADPSRIAAVQKAVSSERADLGLIFDGDADRCQMIDELGNLTPASSVGAVLVLRMMRAAPGANVVHNAVCSRAVSTAVADAGGTASQTAVGHTTVKRQMAALDAVFGVEHSGHYYFRDFWYADSGLLAALHVMAEMNYRSTSLSAMARTANRYHASGELNFIVDRPDDVLADLAHRFEGLHREHVDGMTISANTWWFNVRCSQTEALLRFHAEADDAATLSRICDQVLPLIENAPGNVR